MTDDISLSTALASPFTETIGNHDWNFAPLRFRDWGELEQWMRGRVIGIAREQCRLARQEAKERTESNGDELAEEQRLIMDAAFGKVAMLSLASPEAQTFMQSPDFMVQVLFRSLRKNHASMTPDKAATLFDEVDDYGSLFERIMSVSGQRMLGEEESTDASKKAPAAVSPG